MCLLRVPCAPTTTGRVHNVYGWYDEAVQCFRSSLAALEETIDESAWHLRELLVATDGMVDSLAYGGRQLRSALYDSFLEASIEELKRELGDLRGTGHEAEAEARAILGRLGRRAVLLEAMGRFEEADALDLFLILEWDARAGLIRWFTTTFYSDQCLPCGP